MTTKVVSSLKYLGLFSLVFFAITSCEKEIESIGVNLVENNNFSTGGEVYSVSGSTLNVESVPSNGLSQYLLGVYADEEFGSLKASIATQLVLPTLGDSYSESFGTNVAIDSVIVDIPYQVTQEEDDSDGKPKFTIDSVFGNADKEFLLSVYELKTFLNTLDPTDPSKLAVYNSDKIFQKGTSPLYSGDFKVNANDTVSYIKRYLADGVTVFDIDTIKQTNASPTIKMPLDEAVIKQLLIDNATGDEFLTTDAFNHYFRGLYIEASQLTTDKSHLISLSLANANMTIYYSNDEDEGDEQDLNDNDVDGEKGVRVKHNFKFSFGPIKANSLIRDTSISKESGDNRLYVQGAAGSIATVKLFENDDIDAIRSKNLLVNSATLKFYIDVDASTSLLPEQLFLYNYDEGLNLLDYFTEGISIVGGTRDYEINDDGETVLLDSYTFKITDYISRILKSSDYTDLATLGLRVYNPSDATNLVNRNINVSNFNWNPKGVVLYDGSDVNGDKKSKLEISYTEINN